MPLEFASGQLSGCVLLLEAVSRVARNWCPDSPNGAPLFQVWWVSLADCRPCRQKPLPRCSWSAPVPRGGCLPLSKIVYGPTVSWTLQVRKKSARKIFGRKTDRSVFFSLSCFMPWDRSSLQRGTLVVYVAMWPLCWNTAQVSDIIPVLA